MLHIKSGFEMNEVLPAASGSESLRTRTRDQTGGPKLDRIYHWTGGKEVGEGCEGESVSGL